MYIFPKEFFSNRIFVQGFANLRNFFQRKVFPIIFFPKEFFSKKVVKSRTFFQPHFLLLKLFPKEFFLTEIVSKGTNPQKQEIFSKSFYLNVNFFQRKALHGNFIPGSIPRTTDSMMKVKLGTFFQTFFLQLKFIPIHIQHWSFFPKKQFQQELFPKGKMPTGIFFQRKNFHWNFFPQEKSQKEFFSK